MKLHERTLWYDSVSLAVKDDTGVAYACSVDEEDGPLFSAAPDMARALMEVLAQHRRDGRLSGTRIMEDVLRKAGVIS